MNQQETGSASVSGLRWDEHAWRRAVIDMHISDWDGRFLSQFNADQYVDALAMFGVEYE